MHFIREHRTTIIKVFAFIFVIILLYFLFKDYEPQIKMMFNPQQRAEAVQRIRSHGLLDVILLMLLIYIGSAIPGIPILPVTVLSGVCFGILWGTIINIIAMGLGNISSIKMISVFKKSLEKKYKTNKYTLHLNKIKNPLTKLLLGYAIPMIPSYLVSFAAAKDTQSYTKKIIFLTAFLGTCPLALVYALGGNAILKGSWQQLIILLIFIGLFLYMANKLLNRLVNDKI